MEGFAIFGIFVAAAILIFGVTWLVEYISGDYDFVISWIGSSLLAAIFVTLYCATLMGIITPGG